MADGGRAAQRAKRLLLHLLSTCRREPGCCDRGSCSSCCILLLLLFFTASNQQPVSKADSDNPQQTLSPFPNFSTAAAVVGSGRRARRHRCREEGRKGAVESGEGGFCSPDWEMELLGGGLPKSWCRPSGSCGWTTLA